jgi:hypothetical protein
MKYLVCILFLISNAAHARDQVYFINVEKMKQQKADLTTIPISGRVLAYEGKPGEQLRFYIRNCGKVSVPKNLKGEVPKLNQNITVTTGSPCTIIDWK